MTKWTLRGLRPVWQRLLTWLLLTLMALASPVQAVEVITYFHNDAAGTALAATDTAGKLVWRESYRPYGERLQNQPAAAGNKVWFHGKPVDEDTGLSYFGARYYDPVVGRFMGVDPVGFREGSLHSFNRYTYGNNNPYRFLDPDGRAGETIIPKAIQWIGSKLPRNWRLAGGAHPKTGIPFKETGFPDFSRVAKGTVNIEQTGIRAVDEAAANRAMGWSKTPENYTWHHCEDCMTMELVETAVHSATGHSGGVAVGQGAVGAAVAVGAENAQASESGILGSGISWGDVGSSLLDLLIPGGVGEVGQGSDIIPRDGEAVIDPESP